MYLPVSLCVGEVYFIFVVCVLVCICAITFEVLLTPDIVTTAIVFYSVDFNDIII